MLQNSALTTDWNKNLLTAWSCSYPQHKKNYNWYLVWINMLAPPHVAYHCFRGKSLWRSLIWGGRGTVCPFEVGWLTPDSNWDILNISFSYWCSGKPLPNQLVAVHPKEVVQLSSGVSSWCLNTAACWGLLVRQKAVLSSPSIPWQTPQKLRSEIRLTQNGYHMVKTL